MKFSIFFKKSFYLFVFFAILLAFLTGLNLLKTTGWAAWSGLIISFLNALAGGAIISWGFGKPNKQFYGSFFGGIIGRFIIMFLALFILIKFFDLDETVLVISLLLTYFSFLMLEIWTINKLATLKESE